MKKANFKTVIIGCGDIAGGYDMPSGFEVRSHAKAYRLNPQTELVAVTDLSIDRARNFSTFWHVPHVYDDVSKMLNTHQPDIVSICTPDETHAHYLQLLLKFSPKAVWCEKPLATNFKKAEIIVSQYSKQKILLAVNYQRRFDPFINRLKMEREHRIGVPKKIIVHYKNGILHTGSHAIDLLIDWFGLPTNMRVFDSRVHFSPTDPTINGRIMFGTLPADFIGHDSQKRQVFEIIIFGSRGKIVITNSEPNIMSRVLAKIIACIARNNVLPSDGTTALETLRVCNSLIKLTL